MTKRLRAAKVPGTVLLAPQPGFAGNHNQKPGASRIDKEVRRELATPPFYTVFDHLTFKVDGETVMPMGKVSWPALRNEAAAARHQGTISRPTHQPRSIRNG